MGPTMKGSKMCLNSISACILHCCNTLLGTLSTNSNVNDENHRESKQGFTQRALTSIAYTIPTCGEPVPGSALSRGNLICNPHFS